MRTRSSECCDRFTITSNAPSDCRQRFGTAVTGAIIAAVPGAAEHHVDAEGHAGQAYAAETLFVIRPDNYIGLVTEAAESPPVIAYLQTIIGERPGPCTGRVSCSSP